MTNIAVHVVNIKCVPPMKIDCDAILLPIEIAIRKSGPHLFRFLINKKAVRLSATITVAFRIAIVYSTARVKRTIFPLSKEGLKVHRII